MREMIDIFHAQCIRVCTLWGILDPAPSVGATIKVLEQRAEYGAAEYRIVVVRTPQLGKSVDKGANPGIRVFRVLRVARVDAGVGKYAPHVQLGGRALLAEVQVEGGELLGRSARLDEVVTPGAGFGEVAGAAFEVLCLDLCVLAEREENVEHGIVKVEIKGRCLLDGKATDDHGEGYGEVV